MKMNHETNERNIENLKHIIQNHWFLDDESEDLVLRSIREPRSPLNCHIYNSGLFFDSQHRLWIETPTNKETDEGYLNFYEGMKKLAYGGNAKIFENFDVLISYETWSSGKLPDGRKLFKTLQKWGIETEAWTTSRNTNQNWLVVSKNPVDWLFMSTNQSFKSCMSLESDYSGAFYMGLPVFMADPHYFLVFLTSGKLRRYTLKGREFKHFRVINRSIGVWTNDARLALVRYYPHRSIDFAPILKEAGIIGVNPEPDCWGRWESGTYPIVHKLRFKNGETCEPYRDHSRCPDYDYSTIIYSDRGASGSHMDLNWSDGFQSIRDLYDIVDNDPKEWERICAHCDCVVHEDDTYYIDAISDYVCESCLDEYYSRCEDCDEYYNHNYGDIMYYETLGKTLCLHCISSSEYTRCYHCDELVYTDEVIHEEQYRDAYCQDCRDQLSLCKGCDLWFLNEELDEEGYCDECHDEREAEREEKESVHKQIATEEIIDLFYELQTLNDTPKEDNI